VTFTAAERPPEREGELRLAVRQPSAAERLLPFLSVRAVPGIEHVSARTYRRSVRTADGAGRRLELTVDPATGAVLMRVSGTDAAGRKTAGMVDAAVRLFDLDADPQAIDTSLSADPALAPLVSAAPGTRLPRAADGFELAVRAIVGQQVSVAGPTR